MFDSPENLKFSLPDGKKIETNTYTFSFCLGILPSLALSATQTKWASDISAEQDSGAVLENGIIFNHVTKILLAEKFFNVDFLVPFPKFEMDLRAE